MQINRLFEIIYLLLEKETMTAAQLAERFEVSQRTIYRDVEALSEAGIPVYMSKGKGGGISLLPDFVLNKAVLTNEEKADVLSSLKAVSALSLFKDSEAFEKLDAMLGKGSADWIEVDFSSWGSSEDEAQAFAALKDAIIYRSAVTFDYASVKGERLPRRVYPMRLVFKGQAWYLYAYCTLREEMRFFKFRRISNLTVTDEKFTMTAPPSEPNFKNPYANLNVRGVFEIMPQMAFRVIDEVKNYRETENGSFICEAMFPDMKTICDYASSFGEYCRVVEPQEARDEMKRRFQNCLNYYL